MHEMSVGQAIAATVRERADGRPVSAVDVRIGHLRQVVPDSLLMCWQMLTQGSDLAGAELRIEHVPAVLVCRACRDRTNLDVPIMVCGACESTDVELESGEEFTLVAFEVAGS